MAFAQTAEAANSQLNENIMGSPADLPGDFVNSKKSAYMPLPEIPFFQALLAMLSGIAFILLSTLRWRIHAFYGLLGACLVTGLCAGMPLVTALDTAKEGFGRIIRSLCFIIVLGTTLGVLLEQNGSTAIMARIILQKTGREKPARAMGLVGLLVGLPIFCDSGFIVLSGLARQLSRRTGVALLPIVSSLAVGLYSVHCLLPPHPGASAAAGALGVDMGKLILYGLLVAIPAMLAGLVWTRFASKGRDGAAPSFAAAADEESSLPAWQAFAPVAVPILLIALRAVLVPAGGVLPDWKKILQAAGDPAVALGIGILFALIPYRKTSVQSPKQVVRESVEKAGAILVIIGAGGAFGAILTQLHPEKYFTNMAFMLRMGIIFPFLLAFVLKTAQGSSTVAIITAASLVQPLLPALGLDSSAGRLLATLSMGAGSMAISHANDAYFWVIVKFSGLELDRVLRVYSLATLWMGCTALGVVYLLSRFLI